MFQSAQRKTLTAFALSASLLAFSAPAYAQLDEIIVTAQKKEQNLQDVPIAIQAFDLEALEANRIEGLEDIGQYSPGLYVSPNPADPNGVRINIRGVGTFDPQIGQDSRVAVYKDGVYLGKTQGLAFDLPDMARVEVLKGPQGTLYGRNSTAGAVNLVSARPEIGEGSGKFTAEYGNFNHKKLSGAVNIPMGESIAARVAGVWMDRDGWVENDGPGTDFGGEKKFGIRGAIGAELSPSIRADFAVDYSKVNKEPLFYQSLADSPGVGFFGAAISAFDGRQEEVTTSFAPEDGDFTSLGVSAIATMDLDDNNELKITGAYREMDSSRFVSLIPTTNPAILNAITGGFNQALAPLPFAFGATAPVTGVNLRSDWGDQFPGTPNTGIFISPPGGASTIEGHNQISLEVTLNGETDSGKMEYTLGGFYYDEETGSGFNDQPSLTDANSYLFVLGGLDPRATPASTAEFLAGFGVDPLGPITSSLALLSFLQVPGLGATAYNELLITNGVNAAFLGNARQSAGNDLSIDTRALAIYGQLTYHVNDDFRITGGLRYSDESKDGIGQSKSPFFLDNIDLLGQVIDPNIGSYDDSVLDPALTVEYDLNDDTLVYASYKQAYRAGGFNSAAVGLRQAGETFGSDFIFGREDLTSYEVGMKGDFGDRVRFNAAAFYYDFKNKQTTLSLNPFIATSRAIVNVQEELYGFEADALVSIADGLDLRAGYSYLDGDAGDATNPLTNVVSVREELQGTPKNSFLVGLDYRGEMGGNSELFGSLNYSYKDDILSIPENNLRIGSIGLVSGRIGMDFAGMGDNPVSVSLWGQNLTDEEYLIDSLPFETFAYRTGVYGQPRSFGVALGYKF